MINKSILLACLMLLCLFSINAHSRTEIGFRFIEEDEKTYLEIHLTSLTLFDLIYDLYPELESEKSLKLNNYASDYEAYFNEHLQLNLNDWDRKLEFVDANLITHDAKITFLIVDFKEAIEKYEVAINGFEFYKKPSFTVLFTTPAITETYFLNKTENTCFGTTADLEMLTDIDQHSFYWYGLVIFLVWLMVLILVTKRRRNLSVNR